MYKNLSEFPRNFKIALLMFSDAIALPLSLWIGFMLRLGEWWPHSMVEAWWLFIAAPAVAVPIFVRLGLYRAVIRYVGSSALIAIAKAVTYVTLILLALVVMLEIHGLPRSVFFSFWLISLSVIGGGRIILRGYIHSSARRRMNKLPVAVYGAGMAGADIVKVMKSGWKYEPVVLFDDDPHKKGVEIHGVKVYSPEQIPVFIEEKGISQLLLAMPSIPTRRRHKIIQKLEQYPVRIRTLPDIADLVSGKAKVSEIREVDVGDVLGRDVIPAVPELIGQCIHNKNVMVTGAGGSIGSELCRQIVSNGPSKLILFEQSEYALYKIGKELDVYNVDCDIISVIGSVVDFDRIKHVLKSFSIDTVYHAAAYKHVPLVEHNPIEGLRNNVFGTWNAAEAAMAAGVETFVLISTDKAVRPTNIMGATKRLAELVLQGLNGKSDKTRFTMVRFGNVLDSSGSVIPLFRKQIKKGGPVTVTHPDVTRFFMTIPEAAQLVLQAGSLGKGGDVLVLEMGESIKIDELARSMIRLSGLEVCDEDNSDGDIVIEYTGLRPGEKLYEELLIGGNVSGTRHPKIMRATEDRLTWEQLLAFKSKFELAMNNFETSEVKVLLAEAVSGYKPEKDIVDHVWNQGRLLNISNVEKENIVESDDRQIH